MHTAAAVLVLALTLTVAGKPRAQEVEVGEPPGRLVDIGGRSLHLYCQGAGEPTVVFEAGGSAFAIDWALVQPSIARTTRSCSYDRPRHGWSDPSPSAEMPENVVRDLHALLREGGEQPPYVLVGHSMGGIYVRIFERRFSADVAATVLVDPSHEDGLYTIYEGRPVTIGSLTAEQLLTTVPSGNVNVPLRSPQTGAPFDRLPNDLYARRVELERRLVTADAAQPVPHATVVEAMEGGRAALAELQATSRRPAYLGDRPLIVLTRSVGMTADLIDLHAGLAAASNNSRHLVVSEAGHEIHLYQPDAVIQAVEDVLDALRTDRVLSER